MNPKTDSFNADSFINDKFFINCGQRVPQLKPMSHLVGKNRFEGELKNKVDLAKKKKETIRGLKTLKKWRKELMAKSGQPIITQYQITLFYFYDGGQFVLLKSC